MNITSLYNSLNIKILFCFASAGSRQCIKKNARRRRVGITRNNLWLLHIFNYFEFQIHVVTFVSLFDLKNIFFCHVPLVSAMKLIYDSLQRNNQTFSNI